MTNLERGLSREQKEEVQRKVFLRMGYDERLEYCYRPEEVNGPSPTAWGDLQLKTLFKSFVQFLNPTNAFTHRSILSLL